MPRKGQGDEAVRSDTADLLLGLTLQLEVALVAAEAIAPWTKLGKFARPAWHGKIGRLRTLTTQIRLAHAEAKNLTRDVGRLETGEGVPIVLPAEAQRLLNEIAGRKAG